MVQDCLACSGVHNTSLLGRAARGAMDKPGTSKPSVKKHVHLQERRGSNVSLVLDMSSLENVEPIHSVCTPRDVTLQFLRTSSHVLTGKALQQQANKAQLEEEFWKIPPNMVNPEELDVPGRVSKDRYKTILPNPESRVCLRRAGSQEEEGYINANYIQNNTLQLSTVGKLERANPSRETLTLHGYAGRAREYIATQGPMLNTVVDFWQMVWQESAPLIVMITDLKEGKEQCVRYWPEKEETYGPFTISLQGVSERAEYTVRDLTIQFEGERRLVKHIFFPAWPDQEAPESAKSLLHLVSEVEQILQAVASTGPVVVHCRAGIGRTGCFIATRIGCQQLKAKGEVDILGIVCQLRIDRGGMIQNSEQYQFLHHTLAVYASQLPEMTGP